MTRLVPCLLIAAAAAGCVDRRATQPVVNAPVTPAYDEAMRLRDFPRTDANYVGGGVAHGPTYFDAEPSLRGEAPDGLASPDAARLLDPLAFVGNALVLPVDLVRNPPWRTERTRVEVVPPSYHAAAPLPVSPALEDDDILVAVPTTRPATRPR